MKTRQIVKESILDRQMTEMADAHCHLDLIKDVELIKYAVSHGVNTIITDGVDTKSNIKSIGLVDNKHIFAILGIDPEHANVSEDELNFNIKLIKENANKISGIGEIGLDYGRVKEKVPVEKQRRIFTRFLDLAKELNLPVSIHSREALADVLNILNEKDIKSVHMHFFEGNVQQAKEIEKRGYMISVPPLQSGRRNKVIKEMAIDNIMAETDAPLVGLSPMDVERSIRIVADIKRLDFEKTADLLTQNTKRFFGIKTKNSLMRL